MRCAVDVGQGRWPRATWLDETPRYRARILQWDAEAMNGIVDAIETATSISKPLWLRMLPYVVVVGLVGGSLYAAYHHGCTVTSTAYDARIAAQAAVNAEALTKREADVRKEERDNAEANAFIDRSLLQKATNEITSRDNTIAGLQSGTVRLRDRFTCNAKPASVLPSAAASTGISDAASQGGLQRADAEFLVRYADDANQAALKLQACQAVVRADRKVQP